jgi:hypothetical protein
LLIRPIKTPEYVAINEISKKGITDNNETENGEIPNIDALDIM